MRRRDWSAFTIWCGPVSDPPACAVRRRWSYRRGEVQIWFIVVHAPIVRKPSRRAGQREMVSSGYPWAITRGNAGRLFLFLRVELCATRDC